MVMNCVYFITDGEFIKIGIASDLDRRLSQLQTGNPRELRVLYIIECHDMSEARSLETYLHQRLRDRCVLNEWFTFDRDAIMAAVNSAGYRLRYVSPVPQNIFRVHWRFCAVNAVKEVVEIAGAMVVGAFLTNVPIVGEALRFLSESPLTLGVAIGAVAVVMLVDSSRRRRG